MIKLTPGAVFRGFTVFAKSFGMEKFGTKL